jgi:hypothetical protein
VAYLTRFTVNFFPTILSMREMEEMTTDELRTRTTFHVSSTKNSFFGSRVAGFASDPSCLKYWLLRPFFLRGSHMQREYHKRTTLSSKSSTIKGLLYTPDPDKHKKGTLSNQPRLLRVTSTAHLCCWGCSRSMI